MSFMIFVILKYNIQGIRGWSCHAYAHSIGVSLCFDQYCACPTPWSLCVVRGMPCPPRARNCLRVGDKGWMPTNQHTAVSKSSYTRRQCLSQFVAPASSLVYTRPHSLACTLALTHIHGWIAITTCCHHPSHQVRSRPLQFPETHFQHHRHARSQRRLGAGISTP